MKKTKEDNSYSTPTILLICESPNKVKTLKSFLPSNYIIKASVGHISYIKDEGLYNMGIDVNHDFKASYAVDPEKKELVAELKKLVEKADKVILATDPDREGEAIAWHLKHFLKIPEKKYERVTYQEITKNAILKALSNPRRIDTNLVDAAKCRQKLDKIVGYRLSNIAKKNTGALSVGRCQSAGLKIIVDREKEIQNFIPEEYFELFLNFKKNNNMYSAKFSGIQESYDSSNSINCMNRNIKFFEKFNSKEEAEQIILDCKEKPFQVFSINKSIKRLKPKPPFTTSTLQQEASSKLKFSTSTTMNCAQKLFEGIDLNGQHLALISYHRTDSIELSQEFIPVVKDYIISKYGEEYYNSTASLQTNKNKENVQSGHEAIRPVDLSITPDKLKTLLKESDNKLIKLYTLIYNRTIASQMSDYIYSETTYLINNTKYIFKLVSKEQQFDGFKAVYNYTDDDTDSDNLINQPILIDKELITNGNIKMETKVTKPPKRYSEGTLIKMLDKLGIGRPSTYASIIKILLDSKRNYCNVSTENTLIPTDLGQKLSDFLSEFFSEIISLNYTAELENKLDLIAHGELTELEFLKTFYSNLENNIIKVSKLLHTPSNKDIGKCPKCGKDLVSRIGKLGPFIGCSGYPNCRYIKNIENNNISIDNQR